MTLHETAKESNMRDSIKKYFIDSIYTAENIPLVFDSTLATPRLQGHLVDRWVAVSINNIEMSELTELFIDVYICTRKDNEGFRLAQLRDTVYGYLVDTTKTDGMRRILFYKRRLQSEVIEWADTLFVDWDETIFVNNTEWIGIGGMLVQDIIESAEMETPDQTKFEILTCRLRMASKV